MASAARSPPSAPRRPTTRNSKVAEESHVTCTQRLYHHMDEADVLEDVELYRPGGFHPAMPCEFIGDDDRFEIWNKLGQGTSGIVWLCYDHDKKRFCAVKILRDDCSSPDREPLPLGDSSIASLLRGVSAEEALEHHLVLPTEHFWLDGPNGRHLCTVAPVLGPEVSLARAHSSDDVPLLKDACFQLASGLAFLHGRGVCHGGVRPARVRFRTALAGLTEDEMRAYMPGPRAHAILRLDARDGGDLGGPHAPRCAFAPVELALEDRYVSRDVAIVGFGAAFAASRPPGQRLVPGPWAAPEGQPGMGARPGVGGDLWALGCTMSMILCGETPFDLKGEFSWAILEEALGPVPEPYRSKLVGTDRLDGDTNIPRRPSSPLLNNAQGLKRRRAERRRRNGTDDFLHDVIGSSTTTLHPDWNSATNRLEPRIGKGWGAPQVHIEDVSVGSLPEQETAEEYITRQLRPEAVPGAVDLLKQVFRWLPEERVSAAELLDHPWFESRQARRKVDKGPTGPTFDTILMGGISLASPEIKTSSETSRETPSPADDALKNGAVMFQSIWRTIMPCAAPRS